MTPDNENKGNENDEPLEDFPLADEGRTPRPAAPLPREEPAEDPEEKARMIAQVLELQNTLDDLSQRVDSVKEESLRLRSPRPVHSKFDELKFRIPIKSTENYKS